MSDVNQENYDDIDDSHNCNIDDYKISEVVNQPEDSVDTSNRLNRAGQPLTHKATRFKRICDKFNFYITMRNVSNPMPSRVHEGRLPQRTYDMHRS